MRVLLSTIGSRGEVQPMLALGLELARLGAEVRLCAPPDFRDLIGGFGLEFVPVGPEVSKAGAVRGAVPTLQERRDMIAGTVADQFEAVGAAAADCELLIGCGALQIAARSIAELRDIPYFYAAYAANTLPSEHLPPPPLGPGVDTTADNLTQWKQDADRWNALWAEPLNARRTALGLTPVTDVRDHIFTDHPWLAADPVLGPWPEPADSDLTRSESRPSAAELAGSGVGLADADPLPRDRQWGSGLDVWQPGAWMLRDQRPLAAEIERFLAAGEPPVYFGFGSMHMAPETGRAALDAARALGRRAVILRGWSGLNVRDDATDCLVIGDVDHQALFPRVAAVVHHGGAGTTTAVACAGVPHVVVPQRFDQYYWADRVASLGIGFAHAPGEVTAATLVSALEDALAPETVMRARELAPALRTDGATRAAQRILSLAPNGS
ncbi:glycosyltransferase [Nocardia sp. NPDC059240]|uniref:glycosyltransferase n=1 Tax=Nocardia sp. NPDC059240 TaxID=3346786 RepID=UPI00368409C7